MQYAIRYADGYLNDYSLDYTEDDAREALDWARQIYADGNEEFEGAVLLVREDEYQDWAEMEEQ